MSGEHKVFSPYDGKLISSVPRVDRSEVNSMIRAADELFLNSSLKLSVPERIEILECARDIIKNRMVDFIKLAAHEGGKPYYDSKVEVQRGLEGFAIAIESLRSMAGKEIPMGITKTSSQRIAYTMRQPVGVVAAISAFNHPFNLIVHQIVPAVAVGCPVIVKPASVTPLSCFKLVETLHEAGLPQEWCQVALCDHSSIEKLVSDDRISFLSFIGSAEVGWKLRSMLAPGATCVLEHGGAAPVIVEPDADIANAIPKLVKGGFYHAGQVCVSVQRIFVHESILEQFIEGFVSEVKELKVGDPLNSDTDVGPLITPNEVIRVERWVNEAVSLGTKVLAGGNRISDTCFAPTVLLDPPMRAEIARHEIFGPVVCIHSYSSRDEAIVRANELNFAFQAAVFTRNIDVALDTVRRLNATTVMVNDHTAFRVDWMPFGGRKDSGQGIGGIPYTMEEMTYEKLMVIYSALL